jgi:sorbitol/mannitol transport system permease protein
MATQHSRSAARFMMAPAVILLLGWMLVPLVMTLWFSFRRFLPNRPDIVPGWVGFDNYVRFVTSSSFWPSVQTTLIIVGGALLITIVRWACSWRCFWTSPCGARASSVSW